MFRILLPLTIALASCTSTPQFEPLDLPELTPIELTYGASFVGDSSWPFLVSERELGEEQRVLAFLFAVRRDSTLGTLLEGTGPEAFVTPLDTVRSFLEDFEARDDVVYLHKSASDVAEGEVLEVLAPAAVPTVVGWDISENEGVMSATPKERTARAGNALQLCPMQTEFGAGVEAQLDLIASLPASRSEARPWPDAEAMPLSIPLAAVQNVRGRTLGADSALVLCGTYPQKPWPRVIAVVLRSGESSGARAENGNLEEAAP